MVDAIGDKYNRIKNYDKNFFNPFEKVIKNIQNLIDAGIKVRIRINFDLEKQYEILETINYLT